MKNNSKVIITILSVILFILIVFFYPLPISQKQKEFNDQIALAQEYKNKSQCQKTLEILNELEIKYPQTAIYLEFEKENCYQSIGEIDKMFDSCLNSKLTEYMPTKAAICSIQLSHANRFEDALSIWDKNIQDKGENIFPYAKINRFNQFREKIALTIKFKINNIIFSTNNVVKTLKNNCLATIYYEKGDYDKALDYSLQTKNNLLTGKILLKKGDFEEAQERFKLELNPYRQLEAKAYTHFEKKEYNKAKKCFKEMLEINNITPGTYNMLGEISYLQKDYKNAKYYFKKVLRVEPFNANAQKRLKQIK